MTINFYSEEEQRKRWIESKIENLCYDIARRGISRDDSLYDLILEHVEENYRRENDNYEQ